MELMVYPIEVPTLPLAVQPLSAFHADLEVSTTVSSLLPKSPWEGKKGSWEHLLLALRVPLSEFWFVLIKHISIITTQKQQLRKYPQPSEYEVVRWQWPWSPEGLPSFHLQKCPLEKLVCTITVESFSMGTASPINASDRCKDGQGIKYCEREPPLIQWGVINSF